MKTKTAVKLYIIILCLGTILSLYIPQNETLAEDQLVIPNEAIRLRILANSDREADQVLKRQVRDAVNAEITNWVEELTSIDEARNLLQSKLPEIQEIAEQVVAESQSEQEVKVNFSKVDFPTKLYGQFLYPAGEYEAILISLGDAQGANWWCVLFPPLCFLDFSNGVAVSDGFEEEGTKETAAAADNKQEKEEKTPPVYTEEDEQPVKVKFFLVELWEKIFG
ncbi:stage II sporulation protein R [Bacillus sp. DTU_2020_1000418_1_SI_GHA_SEK_038]|uniref:stage II sporulation protein R n=1 Tax=Bacillus sp. DTU_2020_1000418_1_SI_GHA_SEK_038 TaxID=3077585 RepID=UPI0028EF34BC|nr:stage II sporulation protein R [Bacillus sp. DTU_2020_1000418_1_SI_GHA_SEK_038]WNS75291.1 stage II sporulation protein R [Bacillus sp. DTU_2020_1000418_1_SI_GHA_SEK_038]